jgi:N-methylhydantoinase A
MRRAIRLISVQRGHDLREFTLIAYGGAGPLHAGRLAQELGMARVVVPAHAGVFSALGCVVTEVAYDHVQTYRQPLERLMPENLEDRFAGLLTVAQAPLAAEGHAAAELVLTRTVDVRYVGQNSEIEVPWRGDLATLRRDFEAQHRRLYSYATGEAMECVNLRVRAAVPVAAASLPEWPARGPAIPHAEQRAWFADTGEVTLPVYRHEDLPPEQALKGPALVEDPWATSLVYPGQTAVLDRFGNLVIEVHA